MTIGEYLEQQKVSAEELAAVLTERLDRKIPTATVSTRVNKEFPKSWKEALGLEDVEVKEPPPEVSGKRESKAAPKPTAEFNPMLAEERVAAIYAMVGKGVAAASKEPRYEQAFVAHADKCGHAWAELAKHDKHVATVLTMLTTGGPWGEVIWLHASLGFALVVISGKVEIGALSGVVPTGATAAAPAAAADAATAADANGGSDASPPNPLG